MSSSPSHFNQSLVCLTTNCAASPTAKQDAEAPNTVAVIVPEILQRARRHNHRNPP